MEKLPRTQYSQEFREQLVQFFKESGLTLVEAAKRLSLPKGTLKNWIYADKQGDLATVGKYQKLLSELELELSRVKRELAEVKMERDFIKKVCDLFREGVAVRYGLIESMRQTYPVALMCRVLNVSESGFHAWRIRPLVSENGRMHGWR